MLDRDIWKAAKYATDPGEQMGPTKIPALTNSGGQVQVNPGAKAELLALSFFPERPNLQQCCSMLNKERLPPPDITRKMVVDAIKNAKSYSVPGPSRNP